MSIVAGRQIDSVSFDETILCTIEDNKDKDKGKYIVHYQNASFPAYSQTTNYMNGTKVYVTVPNGDWDQQKIIIGKYTSEDTTPFVFTLPFDAMFDMTGNLVSNDDEDVALGMLLANSPVGENDDKKTHTRLSNNNFEMLGSPVKTTFINETTAVEKDENYLDDFVFKYNKNNYNNEQNYTHIYLNTMPQGDNLDDLQMQGFYKLEQPIGGLDMLGIQADFTTWTREAVVGDFGIAVQVGFTQPAAVEYYEKNTNSSTGNVKDYDIKKAKDVVEVHTFILSNKDMYGNPYNFESNYTQQQVYQIKDLGQITHIRIAFYQDGNFRNIYNERIGILNSEFAEEATETEHDITDLLPENLFVCNVYICAGCELSSLDDDILEIYTNDSKTYNKKLNNSMSNSNASTLSNNKLIKTRWVHLLEDKTPIDVVKGTDKYLDNFVLHWYQYDVSNTSVDARLGPFWKEVKTVEYNGTSDNYEEMFEFTLTPDINKQQEKVVLIIDVDDRWYQSNILYFDNEEIVPNNDTLRYENAIDIVAEDGTFGNYFVYSENGDLEENKFANDLRYMYVAFDNDEDGVIDINRDKLYEGNGVDNFGDYEKVVWTLPLNEDSMLQFYYDGLTEENYAGDGNFTQNSYYVDKTRRKIYVPYRTCPKYKVNGHYYPNRTENTVACSFELNGRLYKTEKEYTFGYSGTMGTDQTIVIDFAEYDPILQQYYSSDRNAVYLNDSKSDSIYLRLRLMDETGTVVDLNTTPDENNGGKRPTEITWFWAATSYIDESGDTKCYLDYEGENAQEANNKGDGVLPNDISDEIPPGLVMVPQEDTQYVKLEKTNKFGMDQLYVVGAKIKLANDVTCDLITYFAIPVALDEKYSHISGPVKVNYLTNGEPYFYNVVYKLFEYKITEGNLSTLGKTAQQVPDVHWAITQGDDFKGAIVNGKDQARLNPFPLYIENAWLYGVNCYQDISKADKPNSTTDVYDPATGSEPANLDNTTGTILWTQPIPIFINRYPSGTLNKWDGKELIIDNKESTIIARGIAAGKKESDNTFTGVIIGDWYNNSDKPFPDTTGVYGMFHGQTSYALMDDGTAYFGRSGMGRIEIDGNNATLQSAGYEEYSGMKIDLGGKTDNGYGDYSPLSPYYSMPYIDMVVRDSKSEEPIQQVILKATSGGSKIELRGIVADKEDTLNKDQMGTILLTNAPDEHPFGITLDSKNQFYVDWDGYMYSNTGQIGGWYIDNHTISANAISNNPETNKNKNTQTSRKNTFSTVVLDDSGIIRVGLKQYKTVGENGYVDRQQLADKETYQNSIVIDGSTDAAYIAINLPNLKKCDKSGIYLKEDLSFNFNSENDDIRGPIFIYDPTVEEGKDDTLLGTIGMLYGSTQVKIGETTKWVSTTNIGIKTRQYEDLNKYTSINKDNVMVNPSIVLESARNVRISSSEGDNIDDSGADHIYLQTTNGKYSTIDMQAKKILINGVNIISETTNKPVAYFA